MIRTHTTVGMLLASALLLLLIANQAGVRAQSRQQSGTTAAGAAATDSTAAVEVTDDRFGGGRAVRLKPQVLLDDPDHKLTMAVERKKRPGDVNVGLAAVDELVTIEFISRASRGQDFGDREVRFLADGKPLDGGGQASNRVLRTGDPARPELRVSEVLITVVPLPRLKEIARAKAVEMRLGSFEFTLSPELLANLRRFVAAAATTVGN